MTRLVFELTGADLALWGAKALGYDAAIYPSGKCLMRGADGVVVLLS